MSQYQTVIFFDLDGTLIVNPFGAAVWPAILGELADKSGQSVETVRARIIEENFLRQNATPVHAVAAMDWDDIVQTVAAQLGVSLDLRCDELVLANALEHSSILDNGVETLKMLSAPHRALVVATKGLAKYQLPVLDALGLLPLFTAVLTPDTHNALKRNPAFFGDWPKQTRLQIMVGDRYDDDIEAPGSYGFKTVWKLPNLETSLAKRDPFTRALLYDYSQPTPVETERRLSDDSGFRPADAIITSLVELPAVVRRLEMSVLGFSD